MFVDGTSTALAATVTGLTNGTSYYFQVAAHSQFGNGAYGSATPAPVTPAGAPASPTNLVGVEGESQVTLTWTAAAANGSAVTDYEVGYSSDGGTNWTPFVLSLIPITAPT